MWLSWIAIECCGLCPAVWVRDVSLSQSSKSVELCGNFGNCVDKCVKWVWVFVSMVPCSLDKTIDNCEFDECLGSVYLLILGKELFSGLTNGNRYSCVRCPDYPYVMFLARCHPGNRYSWWGAWDGNEYPEGLPIGKVPWVGWPVTQTQKGSTGSCIIW